MNKYYSCHQKLLLTGGSGFLGHTLGERVSGLPIRVIGRRPVSFTSDYYEKEIGPDECFRDCLKSIDVVIHCAARAHVMSETDTNPLNAYRKVNVGGTLSLASQASVSGVKRFIYISSIKVNGEQTRPGQPFTENDTLDPQDAYGVSKLEAEEGLLELSNKTGMEVVIIRPPLVYGPGVKGNFSTLMKLVDRSIPLPLGAIKNKRSMVGIDNLIDLIITCVDHPAAANQVFIAGDGEDLSTTALLRRLSIAANKPSLLLPVPKSILLLLATLTGKKSVAQRVIGSLQVDISKAQQLLGWEPPISVTEGLNRCFGN